MHPQGRARPLAPDEGPPAYAPGPTSAAADDAGALCLEAEQIVRAASAEALARELDATARYVAGYVASKTIDEAWAWAGLREAALCNPAITLLSEDVAERLDAAFEAGKRTRCVIPGHERPPKAFERGDHVRLAARLVEVLPRGRQTAPVFTDGRLFCYQPATGLWSPVEEHELSRIVQGFAGFPRGEIREDDGEAQPLSIDHSDVRGAIKLAEHRVTAPNFFASALHGVGYTNGVAIVEPGNIRLVSHAPSNRMTVAVPFAYAANAPRTRWEQFLREVFRDTSDADGTIGFLQEYMGACLLGLATKFQLCVVLVGEGNNGKGVFIHVVSSLFAPGALTAIAPQEWSNEYRLAQLAGARLNAVNELPRAGHPRVRLFQGRRGWRRGHGARDLPPAVQVRAHRRAPVRHQRAARDARSHAWLLAPLRSDRVQADCTASEEDASLSDASGRECAGILGWMLEGGARLLARGRYAIPKSAEDAKAAWMQTSDAVALFIADECEAIPDAHKGSAARELYDNFRQWAQGSGFCAMSIMTFGKRLHALRVPSIRDGRGTRYALRVRKSASMTDPGWSLGARRSGYWPS